MGEQAQDRAVIYARQSRGKTKSIEDQVTLCTEDTVAAGATVVMTERDKVGASRFTGKQREGWPRVLAAIEAREVDLLVIWEGSRGDRNAEEWLGLLRMCRDHDVRIRITSHERVYNLDVDADWRSLAHDGVDSEHETNQLSKRVRRGVAQAAKAGRPAAGPTPYGFRRIYSPTTGELTGQEPDPVTGPIAREIIEKVARSVPLSEIAKDLNTRGIAPPAGREWYRMRIRKIATNPAYIGLRRHKGETHPAGWERLVDEAMFFAAARVLDDPTRMAKGRPGRQVHLLTYLAVCDMCESGIHARATYYACPKGCMNIRRDATNKFVTEVILAALAQPELYQSLRQAGADEDKELLAAEGDAARLRAELDGWRLSAARGRTSEESLAVIEADLKVQIEEADRRVERSGIPPALRQMIEPGADVRERWAEATLQARREVIRLLAEIRVSPARQNAYVPIRERLASSMWRVGADQRPWGEIWAEA